MPCDIMQFCNREFWLVPHDSTQYRKLKCIKKIANLTKTNIPNANCTRLCLNESYAWSNNCERNTLACTFPVCFNKCHNDDALTDMNEQTNILNNTYPCHNGCRKCNHVIQSIRQYLFVSHDNVHCRTF